MSKRNIIVSLFSVGLVTALLLSACAPGGATTPPGGTSEDKSYRVLNPQGIYIPVQTVGLAPRLDNLAGKIILYYQSEANPVMMPILIQRLKAAYPTTTFNIIITEAFGKNAPGDEINGIQAVIRGVSW